MAAHFSGVIFLDGGLPIQWEVPSIGVDSESFVCLFSEVLSGYSPSSGDRPFCVHPQFAVSQVFCPLQGFSSLEGGRTLLPVVRPSIVCLPTLLDPPLSLGGDRSGRIGHYGSEASETMIPEVVIYSGGTSQSSPSSEGPLSTNPCLVNHFFFCGVTTSL